MFTIHTDTDHVMNDSRTVENSATTGCTVVGGKIISIHNPPTEMIPGNESGRQKKSVVDVLPIRKLMSRILPAVKPVQHMVNTDRTSGVMPFNCCSMVNYDLITDNASNPVIQALDGLEIRHRVYDRKRNQITILFALPSNAHPERERMDAMLNSLSQAASSRGFSNTSDNIRKFSMILNLSESSLTAMFDNASDSFSKYKNNEGLMIALMMFTLINYLLKTKIITTDAFEIISNKQAEMLSVGNILSEHHSLKIDKPYHPLVAWIWQNSYYYDN